MYSHVYSPVPFRWIGVNYRGSGPWIRLLCSKEFKQIIAVLMNFFQRNQWLASCVRGFISCLTICTKDFQSLFFHWQRCTWSRKNLVILEAPEEEVATCSRLNRNWLLALLSAPARQTHLCLALATLLSYIISFPSVPKPIYFRMGLAAHCVMFTPSHPMSTI